MRKVFDKMLQSTIRWVLLTGVAFTVTACYGVPPERQFGDDSEFVEDQDTMEVRLEEEAAQMAQ